MYKHYVWNAHGNDTVSATARHPAYWGSATTREDVAPEDVASMMGLHNAWIVTIPADGSDPTLTIT